MKKIILFCLIMLNYTVLVFCSDESTDNSLNFKKAYDFTIGGGFSNYINLQYRTTNLSGISNETSLNINYSLLSLNFPISFSFFVSPKISLGFTFFLPIMNFNMNIPVIADETLSSGSTGFSLNNNLSCLFKLKSGDLNKKMRFLFEVGGAYSLNFGFNLSREYSINISTSMFIGGGPKVIIGFEKIINNFSYEFGGFLEGSFGSSYRLNINRISLLLNMYYGYVGFIFRFNYYQIKVMK